MAQDSAFRWGAEMTGRLSKGRALNDRHAMIAPAAVALEGDQPYRITEMRTASKNVDWTPADPAASPVSEYGAGADPINHGTPVDPDCSTRARDVSAGVDCRPPSGGDLPNGFQRIRHCALFASQRRAAKIARLRELIAAAEGSENPLADSNAKSAEATGADRVDASAPTKASLQILRWTHAPHRNVCARRKAAQLQDRLRGVRHLMTETKARARHAIDIPSTPTGASQIWPRRINVRGGKNGRPL